MTNVESTGRATLASRFGFLMLAAGCAVGLGNVWRFPFVVGRNGGAAFVLLYLVFLAVLGFPLLTAELAIGRGAGKGIAEAMRTLAPPKLARFWGVVGMVVFAGNFLLMIYYTDVAGWLLKYVGDYVFPSTSAVADPAAAFEALTGNPLQSGAFMALAVVIATAVCLGGVVKGVERVTKCMMVLLLVLLGVLAVKALLLPGAAEGVKFYLAPDFSKLLAHPARAVFDAMGQAFFTLSVGIGCMTIFGSYTGRGHSLVTESAWIIVIDTFVALLAGLIIFPVCAAYGVDVTSGPGLIFIALPKVFQSMPGGRVWGLCFFLFLGFAALTTIIAVFECIIGGLADRFNVRRVWLVLATGVAVGVCSLPCVLFKPVLGWEDFAVSQVWLPVGGLVLCVFSTQPCGWGWEHFCAEASTGAGWRVPYVFGPLMKFFIPLCILFIFFLSL